MRRWQVKQGNYIGDHYIFDTEQEAGRFLGYKRVVTPEHIIDLTTDKVIKNLKELPETFPHWTNLTSNRGDWVRTDDGRIVKILARYIMKNRKSKIPLSENPNPIPGDTVYTRFCFCSTAIYIKLNSGILRYNYCHADFFAKGENNTSRSSIGSINRYLTKSKRLFAYYLAIVGNPVKAYHLANPGHYSNKLLYQHIAKRAMTLMKDKYVLQELLSYMTIEEYRTFIQGELEKTDLSMRTVFEEILRGLREADPATDDHREMIKIAVEAIEKVNNVKVITADGKQTIEMSENAILPLPNPKIESEVRKNTPELLDFVQSRDKKAPDPV